MVQFMKAMRDEKGEMVRNAHLIGFFRRICKLMFLRTKPVFVFDGGTPALKRHTVIARRRQRENAQAKVRKTAEKLLLNHLKAMRLKELAEDLENQRKKNDAKGKKVINDETEIARNNVEEKNNVPANFNQEELDAMLAASLAEEEDRDFAGNASTSGAGVFVDEEEGDDDEDEEIILPTMSGRIDPAVLASLPPSMQLDLLVQMRERLMAENRQKYQKVKKAPAKFSELQIQSYLKTVAFRREINLVQKSAAGKDVGGVQTSRIASEANREFIFSSSFSGDKEALASVGVEGYSKNFPHTQPSEISFALLGSISSSSKSNAGTGSVADNQGRIPVKEIEIFKDHRERFRASRRALGIQMTRDLQRNLDLIKEIEQDRTQTDDILNMATNIEKTNQFEETSYQPTDDPFHPVDPKYSNDQFKSTNEKLMEIYFEDDGGDKCLDGDDEIFARLVAGDDTGDATMISLVNNGSSKNHSFSSDSDCDWEGVSREKVDSLTPAAERGNLTSRAEGGDDDSEVEWEDDDSYDPKCASLSATETRKIVSKGVLEEEADFQEALRRSLKDLSGSQSSDAPFDAKKPAEAAEIAHEAVDAGSLHQENENGGFLENPIEIDEFSNEVLNEVGRLEAEAIAKKTISDDLSGQLATSMADGRDITGARLENSKEICAKYDAEPLEKEKGEAEILLVEVGLKESGYPGEEIAVPFVEQLAHTSETGKVPMFSNKFSAGSSQISDMVLGGTSDPILADAHPNLSEAAANDSSTGTTKQRETHMKESTANHEAVQKFPNQKDLDNTSGMRGDEPEELLFRDDLTNPSQFTKAGLEEEIQSLNQECIELGDQQKKLNRNMESVSSEMFAECQELLQMFGLPYIIAPMEAEAQCAYMELAGLVDGVVSDDSDAFLFGATSVYKNIFDDRKYVETYFMKDIENELGLSRDKLIRMALLLGSDYTEGVSGIGIVNAIEVVNAFPEEDGFRKFREWIESPDPNILGKVGAQTGSTSRKTGSRVSNSDTSCSNGNGEGLSASELPASQNTDNVDETKQVFMDKHRNVSKNWHIPSNFPNEAVISAYTSPEVDKSTESFSWGKPDHLVLCKLCWEKFGWNVQKADELLVPVLKEYSKRETQLRLEAFYTFNEKFAKIRSKRIKKAVKGIKGNVSTDLIDETVQETSKGRKKRRVSPDKSRDDVTQKPSSGTSKPVTEDESISAQRSSKKLSSKRKHGEAVPFEEKNKESVTMSRGRKTSKGISGRGRIGNKRGQAVGRGQSRKNHNLNSSRSSGDRSNSDYEEEMHVEEVEGSLGARKSARTRKAVKYTLDELENDEPSKEDQHEMNFDKPEANEEQSPNDHGIAEIDTVTPVEKNEEKVGDPSLVEGSNEDYLEMGGRFCMDEVDLEFDTGAASSMPKNNSSFDEELSTEYLRVGGGFCLEEDDTNKEPVKGASDEFQDEYAGDGKQSLDASTPTVGIDCSTLAGSPHQGTEEADSHLIPAKSLCAMPALKRKRRKR